MHINEKNRILTQYFVTNCLYDGFNLLIHYIAIILNNTLTPMQVGVLFTVYNLTAVIFEIPTGSLADRIGRKNLLTIAKLFHILAIILVIFDKSFLSFFIYFFLVGISDTLFSGALDALHYDNMKAVKIESKFNIYQTRKESISLIGGALSAFLSSFIVKYYGYNSLFFIELFVAVLFIIFLFFSIDYYKTNKNLQNLTNNYLKILKNTFSFCFKHKSFLKLILFSSTWFGIWVIFIIYNSIYYSEITQKPELVGVLIGIASIIIALFQEIFIRFFSKKNISIALIIQIFSAFVIIVGTYIYSFSLSYIFYILFFILSRAGNTLVYVKQQAIIPSKIRASMVSVISFFGCAVKSLNLLLIGYISGLYNYRIGFLSIAFLYLACCVVFYFIIKQDKHLNKNLLNN